MSPNRMIKVPAPRALTPFFSTASNDQASNKSDSILSSSFSSTSVSSISSNSSSSTSSFDQHHQLSKSEVNVKTLSTSNSKSTQAKSDLSSIIPSPDSPDALIQNLIDTYYYTDNSNTSSQNLQNFPTYPTEEMNNCIASPRRRLPPPPLNLTKSNFTELENNNTNYNHTNSSGNHIKDASNYSSMSHALSEDREKQNFTAAPQSGHNNINNNNNNNNNICNIPSFHHVHKRSFTEHIKHQNRKKEALTQPNLNGMGQISNTPRINNPSSQIESILPADYSRDLRKLSHENLNLFSNNNTNADCCHSSAFPRHVVEYVYDNSTTDISYMGNDNTNAAGKEPSFASTCSTSSSKSPMSFTSMSSSSFAAYPANFKVASTEGSYKNYEYTPITNNNMQQIHHTLFKPGDANGTSYNSTISNNNSTMIGTKVESLDKINSNSKFPTTNKFTNNTKIEHLTTQHILHPAKRGSGTENLICNPNVKSYSFNKNAQEVNNTENEKKQYHSNHKALESDETPVNTSPDLFQEYALENPYLKIAKNRSNSSSSQMEMKTVFDSCTIPNPTIAIPKEALQKNSHQRSLDMEVSHSTSYSMSDILSVPQIPPQSLQRAHTRYEIHHVDKRYQNLAFF